MSGTLFCSTDSGETTTSVETTDCSASKPSTLSTPPSKPNLVISSGSAARRSVMTVTPPSGLTVVRTVSRPCAPCVPVTLEPSLMGSEPWTLPS